MITPFPVPGDDTHAHSPDDLDRIVSWATAVSRMSGEKPLTLPGIVSPLEFSVDFAVNAQADAASVTLGNGVVRLPPLCSVLTSGILTLSLRWTPGYCADGVREGDLLFDDWVVDLVQATRIDLRHAALVDECWETTVPMMTIVKPSAAETGDEFTARVSGEALGFRGAGIRGWAHG
ncbi:hypothetical protein [Herbiconiux ginsengi]|uniref:Uncharacterized protein n=1 Tax=Herbiconiux ginsengi TaxID=381665 RepID=A0A1H3U5J4_9MICO|nr:hypothetical protein [Herbiconiux ginsengi]SDZ57557.1 hypothetical protein SAMN05216554_0143 [Herbiconiux ginsengi]